MKTYKVTVHFVDEVTTEILVAAMSDKSAKRIGRNRAIGLRPYAGSPIKVDVKCEANNVRLQ